MTVVALLLLAHSSCQREPVGVTTPVTKELLANTECIGYTGSRAKFHWSFSADTFRIEADPDPIPQELLNKVVGKETSAKKVEGNWRIEGSSVILFDSKADGQLTGQECRLDAINTGAVRITIPGGDGEQFVFGNTAPPKK